MDLTQRTDYGLRILIFLALREDPEELASRREIADAYDISKEHVAKITAELSERGYLHTRRGRGGGMRLAVEPEAIAIGDVVRDLEPDFALAECLGEHSDCPIEGVCALEHLLVRAREEFLETLDRFTLDDVAVRKEDLRERLGLRPPETLS